MARMLYEEKQNDEWTNYMSIKRERQKRDSALDIKISRLTAT